MPNNFPAFRTELFQTLSTSTNVEASRKTELASAVISAYQSEWDARVASGTADNAANRGRFVADEMFQFLSEIVKAYRHRTDIAALPVRGGLDG